MDLKPLISSLRQLQAIHVLFVVGSHAIYPNIHITLPYSEHTAIYLSIYIHPYMYKSQQHSRAKKERTKEEYIHIHKPK